MEENTVVPKRYDCYTAGGTTTNYEGLHQQQADLSYRDNIQSEVALKAACFEMVFNPSDTGFPSQEPNWEQPNYLF